MDDIIGAQEGWQCRLAWGRRGVSAAAARGDVLVVVDVLSFSSSVVAAVSRGARVFPCQRGEGEGWARRLGAELAVRREDVPERGRYSLSPLSLSEVTPEASVVLPSPNGATCSRLGAHAPAVFVGCLLNAGAAARAAERMLRGWPSRCVTVVACGERWQEPSEDGALRFAVEDMVGAGAVIAQFSKAVTRSPEASVCAAAFTHHRDGLEALLRGCGSGAELKARGFADDVRFAARLDVFDAAPRLEEGWFISGAG